jgi:hypothetical protein
LTLKGGQTRPGYLVKSGCIRARDESTIIVAIVISTIKTAATLAMKCKYYLVAQAMSISQALQCGNSVTLKYVRTKYVRTFDDLCIFFHHFNPKQLQKYHTALPVKDGFSTSYQNGSLRHNILWQNIS